MSRTRDQNVANEAGRPVPSATIGLVADGLLTVQEAAGFLRVSRSTIYLLMDRGELAFVKLGRSRRIPRLAVIELAARELRDGFNVTG